MAPADSPFRVVSEKGEESRAAIQAQALAHLLAILKSAVQLMDECGQDVDARVIEAHAAQLAAGREWPGVTSAEIESCGPDSPIHAKPESA